MTTGGYKLKRNQMLNWNSMYNPTYARSWRTFWKLDLAFVFLGWIVKIKRTKISHFMYSRFRWMQKLSMHTPSIPYRYFHWNCLSQFTYTKTSKFSSFQNPIINTKLLSEPLRILCFVDNVFLPRVSEIIVACVKK